MRYSKIRLRVAASLTTMLTVSALLASVAPVSAVAVESCVADDSFCVSYDLVLTSTVARSAAGAAVTIKNVSDGHLDDQSLWISAARFRLPAGSATKSTVTASANLADGLIVAGGGPCTSPAFTDCAGGSAKLRVAIDGTTISDGVFDGTLGIKRIENVNPPAAGLYSDFIAVVEVCVSGTPIPVSCQEGSVPVQLEQPGAGEPLAPSVTIPTSVSMTVFTGTLEAAAHEMTLNLKGSANKVWDGDSEANADKTYRVLSLPARCGQMQAGLSVKQWDSDTFNLTVPRVVTITGCPVPSFTTKPQGFTGLMNGAASYSPVAGRTIKSWHWDFGDTKKKVTTTAAVSHVYTTYGSHSVKLFLTDSAGAISSTLTKTIKGTLTSVTASRTTSYVRTAGKVTPGHAGKSVTVALQRRNTSGIYKTVANRTATLTSTSAYAARFPRAAAGKCQLITTFPGDADHLGSRGSVRFDC